MSENKPEFDALSSSYEELLRDPIRDRFGAGGSEFFHVRKRDLIREYFRGRGVQSKSFSFLDLGCGKGELLSLLRGDFSYAAGCDPSAGMLEAGGLKAADIDARVQHDPARIPFDNSSFDFVTAVCVYHHVPPPARAALTDEVRRVLKPGGIFSIIEHNPYNPATRLIVSRTPVDADAILLRASETRSLLRAAGFRIDDQRYFLYFPEGIYRKLAGVESALSSLPMGGQYAVFATREELAGS